MLLNFKVLGTLIPSNISKRFGVNINCLLTFQNVLVFVYISKHFSFCLHFQNVLVFIHDKIMQNELKTPDENIDSNDHERLLVVKNPVFGLKKIFHS